MDQKPKPPRKRREPVRWVVIREYAAETDQKAVLEAVKALLAPKDGAR